METLFNSDERKRIREGIEQKYRLVAVGPEGRFSYPTGRAGLEGQKYDREILRTLPGEVLASYCGVGNPFSPGAKQSWMSAVGRVWIRSSLQFWLVLKDG